MDVKLPDDGLAAVIMHECERDLTVAEAQPFLLAATFDTVTRAEFARYIEIEQRFVWTAARAYGLCLWESVDHDDIRYWGDSIGELLGPQIAFFAEISGRWPLRSPLGPEEMKAADSLSDVLLAAGRELGAAGIVTCMLAAETLYARWCARAATAVSERTNNDLGRWIDLHATTDFQSQPLLLGHMLNSVATIDTENSVRLTECFRSMLAAENSFHAVARANPPHASERTP